MDKYLKKAEELCKSCPHKMYCSALCPEAEAYASQDEVPQTELNIGLPRYGRWPEPIEKSRYTHLEQKVMHALADGKTRAEIAQFLGITRQTVRSVLRNIRKKHS